MIATTAKLRELVAEIEKPRPKCISSKGHSKAACPGCVHAIALNTVYSAAPAIARLVLQLSEALEQCRELPYPFTQLYEDIAAALAAVEELRL